MNTFVETTTNITVDTFDNTILQVNRYTLLIILVLGNIGTCLNLLVYHRPIYISSSCTIYLIASSINTFILLDFALLTRLLEAGFEFRTSAESVIYCKIRTFIYYSTMTFSIYCTVLASIDRYLSTLTFSFKLNYLQNQSTARIATIILAFLCLAAYGHILQYFGIDPIHHHCCPCLRSFYVTFFAWFFIILYCLLPTTLMSIFAILTVRNIHQLRRVLPNNIHMLRHREHHLIRIILFTIIITLLFTLPFVIKQFYTASIGSKLTSLSKQENLLMDVLRLCFYVNHAIAFYINLIASKGFRKEFLKMLKHYHNQCLYKHKLNS